MFEKRFTDVWCSETGEIGFTDDGVDITFTGGSFEEFLNETEFEKRQLKNQIKVFNEFLRLNNLEIDWHEFCCFEWICPVEEENFPCQDCKYMIPEFGDENE